MNLLQTKTHGGNPVQIWIRPDTNDSPMLGATFVGDEYHLKGKVLTGWALDIGAHIGVVSVAMALDNPALRVIAVEPVPENYELLTQNVKQNGLEGRIIPILGAANGVAELVTIHYGYRHFRGTADAYTNHHRFVAETFQGQGDPEHTIRVPGVTLEQLLSVSQSDFGFCKIDCEGCEWCFLDPLWVHRLAYIIGEYHMGLPDEPHVDDTHRRLNELLGATHNVSFFSNNPIAGGFEAVRK